MHANPLVKLPFWICALTFFLSIGCSEQQNDLTPEHLQSKEQPNLLVVQSDESKPQKRQFTGVHLMPTAVMDTTGFGQPLVAATLFIPNGWKTSGGIEWGQQFSCTNGYAFNWRAQSPDGRTGMLVLPQQRWEWNQAGQPSQPGCAIATTDSVEAYIKAILGEVLPDARIRNLRTRPDLESELANLNSESNTGFQYNKAWVSAAEALVEFTQEGEPMRGILVAAVQFSYLRTGGGQYGVAIENYSAFALPSYGAFGPADSFNPALFERLRRSLIANPSWEAQIAQHNATMGRIAREGIMARAKIHHDAMTDIAQIQQDAWNNQQKAADVRAREFSEIIRDVETYNDDWAPGGQVEFNSFYKHAWRLDDGSYVMTNDISFQPYRDLGVDGKALTPAGDP